MVLTIGFAGSRSKDADLEAVVDVVEQFFSLLAMQMIANCGRL